MISRNQLTQGVREMTDLKPFCIKIHQFGKMLLFKKCVGCALTEVKRKRKVDMRTFLNSG